MSRGLGDVYKRQEVSRDLGVKQSSVLERLLYRLDLRALRAFLRISRDRFIISVSRKGRKNTAYKKDDNSYRHHFIKRIQLSDVFHTKH